ncbi:hypothetical protein [Nonomuraea sp. KM90]|uniref:hypothetical protein n=1 Tax=Nonomuraea sp. KM90 TaxID=3457428 RepID=UPI003FCD733D
MRSSAYAAAGVAGEQVAGEQVGGRPVGIGLRCDAPAVGRSRDVVGVRGAYLTATPSGRNDRPP